MQRCLFALLREFARRLKSKRDEFAARILQEEQLVKSRKRQQAPIPPANRRLSSLRRTKDKLLNYLDHGHASASEERPAVVSDIWHYMVGSDGAMIPKLHFHTLLTRFSSSQQYREWTDTRSSSAASSVVDLEEAALDHRDLTECLAEPEFSGLWEQEEQQVPLPSKSLRAAKIKPP